MKKITFLFLVSILFLSCSTTKKEDTAHQITVSLAPQKFFLQKIVGDFANVFVLVPSGNNPEIYDPSPSEIAELESSDAYFAIGTLPFETEWMTALPAEVAIINQAKLLPEDLIFSHDAEHAHVHIHGDPHYWTSITGARAMAEVMYREVVKIYPDQEEVFQANYQLLLEEIEGVEQLAQEVFSEHDNRAFVIYHPSLSLFADEWHLQQLVIEENGMEPTPRHLVQLMDKARSLDTKVVLIQQEFDVKNAESIAKELNLPLITIQPLAEDWGKEMKQLIESFR